MLMRFSLPSSQRITIHINLHLYLDLLGPLGKYTLQFLTFPFIIFYVFEVLFHTQTEVLNTRPGLDGIGLHQRRSRMA